MWFPIPIWKGQLLGSKPSTSKRWLFGWNPKRCATKGVKNASQTLYPSAKQYLELGPSRTFFECFCDPRSGVRCIALTTTWQRIWCLGCLPFKHLQTLQAAVACTVPVSSSIILNPFHIPRSHVHPRPTCLQWGVEYFGITLRQSWAGPTLPCTLARL